MAPVFTRVSAVKFPKSCTKFSLPTVHIFKADALHWNYRRLLLKVEVLIPLKPVILKRKQLSYHWKFMWNNICQCFKASSTLYALSEKAWSSSWIWILLLSEYVTWWALWSFAIKWFCTEIKNGVKHVRFGSRLKCTCV